MLDFAFALLLATAAAPTPVADDGATEIPADFVEHRIIAHPRTHDGEVLNLWVDTGGGGGPGMYLLTDAAAERLGLQTRRSQSGAESLLVAAPPRFAPGAALPASGSGQATALVIPDAAFNTAHDGQRYDGMLGAGYLAGDFETPRNIWTFDYPGGRLVLQSSKWRAAPDAHATPLHFPTDAQGRRGSGFPRIVVEIDGQPLSLLLDTGATGFPTPASNTAQGGTPSVRATSFITSARLERWHREHPQWRLVEDADRMRIGGKAMRAIEVPSIAIAGWTTGLVWFTERPDKNFHEFMSSMMDARVDGALGGNALAPFVMTVDYGRAQGWFECARGCRAAER